MFFFTIKIHASKPEKEFWETILKSARSRMFTVVVALFMN